MAFPADELDIVVELALGADLTADPDTWVWTEITPWCKPHLYIEGIGRSDEQSSASSALVRLRVNNRDGRFVRLNPNSPYYGLLDKGTPIRVAVTDGTIEPSKRFQGFIAELPPRWEAGTGNQWVPITASGVLRRLDQVDTSDSALRSYVMSTPNLRTYWPLEDEANSARGSQTLEAQLDMRVIGDDVSWGRYNDLPGSASAPALTPGAKIRGAAVGSSPGPWMVTWWARGDLKDDAVDGTWLSARVTPRDTDVEWIVTGTRTDVTVTLYDINNTLTVTVLNAASELPGLDLVNGWHSIALMADGPNSGGIMTITLLVDGQSAGTRNLPGRDVGRIGAIIVPDQFDEDRVTSMGVGHVAVWDGFPSNVDTDQLWRVVNYWVAGSGYDGESAGDRVRRVCQQQGIPYKVIEGIAVGDNPASSRMGPQAPSSLGRTLQDCEEVDAGLLYEDPGTGGIGYLARTGVYAAASGEPSMTLDIAAGDLQADFEPDDGDQYTVNSVTASRRGGSSAHVQDIAAGDVPYARSVTLNVDVDDALSNQASWRVHLGQVDEYRYPVLVIDLAARPHLIPQWARCGIGSRITIANPPPGHPPDLVDLIIVGYSELIDGVDWEVSLNCMPAAPYRIASLQGEMNIIQEDFEDDQYEIDIAFGGDAPWFRTQDDAHTGTWSLRSGEILHDATSDAIITIPENVARFRFAYRISCEPNFDQFQVLIGGAVVFESSGVAPWRISPYLAVVPGQEVTLRYIKDGTISRYGDRVYVDDFQFEGVQRLADLTWPSRLDTGGSEIAAAVDATATTLVVATDSGSQPWIEFGNGLTLPGQAGSYVSTPSVPTSRIVSAAAKYSDAEGNGPDDAAIAPSVSATNASLLVCAWTSWNSGQYDLPGSMTEIVQQQGVYSTSAVAVEQVGAGPTGAKVAGSHISFDTWSAASIAIPGGTVTDTGWDGANDAPVSVTTGPVNAGDWLIAVHALGDAAGNAPVPEGLGWARVADSGHTDSFVGSSRTVVWAREVALDGPQTVALAAPQNPTESHLTVLVLSGVDVQQGLNIAGGLEAQAEITPWMWPPDAPATLVSKWDETAGGRSFRLGVLPSMRLDLEWSEDGDTVQGYESTLTLPDGHIAASGHLEPDIGGGQHRVTFWTAPSLDGPWAQLGHAHVGAGTTSVYASETPLEIGAHGHGAQAPFNGVVYAVQVLDSGLTIADPDFTEQPTGTGAFTDTVGNPWTVHGAAQIGPEDKFDIVAGGEVMRVEGITGAFSPQTFQVVRSINTVVKPQAAGTRLRLHPKHVLAL